jgi:hypothetical protein
MGHTNAVVLVLIPVVVLVLILLLLHVHILVLVLVLRCILGPGLGPGPIQDRDPSRGPLGRELSLLIPNQPRQWPLREGGPTRLDSQRKHTTLLCIHHTMPLLTLNRILLRILILLLLLRVR